MITTTLIYTPLALLHVLLAAAALAMSVASASREKRRSRRAWASLVLAVSGAAAIGFALFDMYALSVWRRHDAEQVMLLAVPVALLAAMIVPGVARRLERAGRQREGWVHDLAASPAWPLMALLGVAGILSRAGMVGWLALTPVLLVPMLPFDAPLERPLMRFAAVVDAALPATAPAAVPVAPPPPVPGVELARATVCARDSRCPVCGDHVSERARACVLCHTPHHAECFEFNGRCAIYGCQSVTATPLRAAATDAQERACAPSSRRTQSRNSRTSSTSSA